MKHIVNRRDQHKGYLGVQHGKWPYWFSLYFDEMRNGNKIKCGVKPGYQCTHVKERKRIKRNWRTAKRAA